LLYFIFIYFNRIYPLAEEYDLIITSLIEEFPAFRNIRGIQVNMH